MQLSKTILILMIIFLLILMIIFGILVDSGLQVVTSTNQASPTPTSTSTPKVHIIGIIILVVISVSGVFGFIILGCKHFKVRKDRKDHEITPRLYSTEDGIDPYSYSEKSITTQPSRVLTKNRYYNLHPTGNRDFVPNNRYNEGTEGTYMDDTNINVIPQQKYNLDPPAIQRLPPVKRNYNIPLPKNMNSFDNNNSSGEENKIVKFGSELDLNDNQKETSILKVKKNEALTCMQCGSSIFGKDAILSKSLSFKDNNGIICQITSNSDDSTNSTTIRCKLCNSSRTQTFGSIYDGHRGEAKGVPRDLQHNIPAELYTDEFTIVGQGTFGLKFQAKESFRIVLNSNKEQSYGKTDVVVLDIGDDVTYFRKRNNDNPLDILAFTKERKALLDKDMNQHYWLSLDKKNRRLRYGKGPMQSLLTVFCYNFPPKPSQGIDEYAWIEKLRYVAISGIAFQKKDFIEDKPKIELKSCSLPVTVDLPPFIINHEDATLDELETGNATVIENLPEECKELYWNIVGSKISLNSSDFPDFADAIEYSINTPGMVCYEKLKEKASGFGDHNPKKTYLRVTLGEDRGNSPGVPYVLEIWPSGHYSPIHSHSNSFGIIKVLYNEIVARYFTELQPKDQEWYYEATFKEGQVTWISDKFYQTHQLWNRTRKVCATIQCYQYGDINNEHYEYFDYIDNNNIVKQFKPNTDWPFSEFKKLIKKEWDRHKYLSPKEFLFVTSNAISHQLDK